MASITDEEFNRLLSVFERKALHLETRDSYGTAVELPHMAKWAAGERDGLDWLQGWCSTLREHVNDFYLFDDRLIVFLIYAGNGLVADKVTSTDPAGIRHCRSAFEAVWKLSIPHRDYQPF